MDTITLFFEHNIIVVYFGYGLAFFCMGLAVWLESGHTAEFRMARAMGPLAGFGLVHGLHEWFEMFQRLGRAGATTIPSWLLLDEVRLAHLVLSFVLLIMFGVRLIDYSRREQSPAGTLPPFTFAQLALAALLLTWGISLAATWWLYRPDREQFLLAVDVLSRYILGIPGALLSAWAIVLEQQTFALRGMPGTGRDLLRAALALLFYGVIGQIFLRKSFLFPSTIINSDWFSQTFGIPIQLFRACAAMAMAIFVIRALRAFELENQQRLLTANQARLEAQQKTMALQERAHQETETLNEQLQTTMDDLSQLYRELQDREAAQRDLLHQVVTAQEQERQRIARDLHDTTGQALTALGLGLAAVGEAVSTNPELAARQLGQLKGLTGRALEELRDLIGNLRPAVLDDLGLVPAIQGFGRDFEAHSGIQTSITVSGRKQRLPPELETTIFRVFQEALTNVARHAGANQVTIQLMFRPDSLNLIIADDGRGFDPQQALQPQANRRAWGLLGMRERVALVQGQCDIQSAPGRGCTIQITIPLKKEDPHDTP